MSIDDCRLTVILGAVCREVGSPLLLAILDFGLGIGASPPPAASPEPCLAGEGDLDADGLVGAAFGPVGGA